MARSIKALATPALLAWARHSAGLDIAGAAKRISVTEEVLKEWEAGESHPTIAKLRKAAEVYKRPSAVFYLPAPPRDFDALRDFRRLPDDVPADFSPKLRYLIRRVRERQAWAIEARREMNAQRIPFVGIASLDDSVVELASRASQWLGSNVADRGRFPAPEETLRYWSARLEANGVFIFQSSDVDPIEMRGFALPDSLAPAIAVNSKDSRAARVFTLLHEFGHILLASEGISNLDIPPRPRTREQRTEVFCNALAAEILVPAADLRSSLDAFEWRESVDASLLAMSKTYGVSREVIARRMTDLGFTTREFYQTKREEYQKEFETRAVRARGEFRVPRARMVVRDNGRAFTRLVLTAYGDNSITGRDVSHLLNLKLNHLARLEIEVFGNGSRSGAGG